VYSVGSVGNPFEMNVEAQKIVAQLGLAPLPGEGGWFRQTWLSATALPGGRAVGSAIYFLVTPGDFSALHRLKTDEIWLHHAGDPLEHVMLLAGVVEASLSRLGPDVLGGEVPQLIVPGGVWQGARLAAGASRGWALVSCTMAPAWDETECELGVREALLRELPSATTQIHSLTR
jgi:predicted cupin superfamily sugar epimerase